MKNVKLLLLPCLSLCSLFLMSSCEGLLNCGQYGELKVTNKSIKTVHRIVIDGTDYGTIDPDESKTIELAEGKYTLEFEGISGGGGCSPTEVTIVACDTETRVCRN